MNVLIANDDGIQAEGLRRLAEALSERADVFIAAPKTQMSAAGHSITMRKSITAEEADFENAEGAFMIDGTPADCVKIGIRMFEERGVNIDMVYSVPHIVRPGETLSAPSRTLHAGGKGLNQSVAAEEGVIDPVLADFLDAHPIVGL